MMNIDQRVTKLECIEENKMIGLLQERILFLEDIIENKLGFYIPKKK